MDIKTNAISESGTINFEFLLNFIDNDMNILVEMVEVYLVETPHQLQKLSEFANEEEWKEVGEVAHAMKTSARYMGMKSLCEELLLLEKYGRRLQRPDEIPGLVQSVTEICSQALQELQAMLPELHESLKKA